MHTGTHATWVSWITLIGYVALVGALWAAT
jgi:hypothetical protein